MAGKLHAWHRWCLAFGLMLAPGLVLGQMPAQEPPPLPHPEIPPPVDVMTPWPWWLLVLAGLLLLGLVALVLFLILANKPKAVVPVRRPLQDAVRRMKDLRGKADVLPPSEVGHGVSEILRRYYMERYSIPAPFKTTQELFPLNADVDKNFRRRAWRERFEPLAELYDSLAYAPLPATSSEAIALVETAINKLEEERLLPDE
ncbi:MAG: DUF4381 family protein [Verrucomicrobiaceae bacterium]|nr:DUF4381 family protein [Verrucomicrobiaceae bacterium]